MRKGLLNLKWLLCCDVMIIQKSRIYRLRRKQKKSDKKKPIANVEHYNMWVSSFQWNVCVYLLLFLLRVTTISRASQSQMANYISECMYVCGMELIFIMIERNVGYLSISFKCFFFLSFFFFSLRTMMIMLKIYYCCEIMNIIKLHWNDITFVRDNLMIWLSV